ncbi:putative membrane protein [Bacillus cereus]|nr:putative membrane protein [Bacillus cereus]
MTVTENVTGIEMLGAIVPTSIPVLGLALSCGMLFTKTLPSIKVVPPGILSVNTTAVVSVFPVFVKVVV